MCCGLFECVRGVVFVAVIFSINSCDNLCIYYFGSVSCIQCIVIKPPSKLINFPLTKVTIRVIERAWTTSNYSLMIYLPFSK